jgi:hypothetical protein
MDWARPLGLPLPSSAGELHGGDYSDGAPARLSAHSPCQRGPLTLGPSGVSALVEQDLDLALWCVRNAVGAWGPPAPEAKPAAWMTIANVAH